MNIDLIAFLLIYVFSGIFGSLFLFQFFLKHGEEPKSVEAWNFTILFHLFMTAGGPGTLVMYLIAVVDFAITKELPITTSAESNVKFTGLGWPQLRG